MASCKPDGSLLSLPGGIGSCQRCGSREEDLEFRCYRHVVAMLVLDRLVRNAGYYCRACRKRLFAKHMGMTLVLGWWGLIAFFFHNPVAIVTNVWALFSAPLAPGRFGALNVRDLQASSDAAPETATVTS
jgi:hypothetical protein